MHVHRSSAGLNRSARVSGKLCRGDRKGRMVPWPSRSVQTGLEQHAWSLHLHRWPAASTDGGWPPAEPGGGHDSERPAQETVTASRSGATPHQASRQARREMLRATWRGSISVGPVTVPVRLYAAVRRRDVRFRELDRATGQRVRRQRIRDVSAPEIEWITVPSDAPATDQPGYPRAGGPPAGSRGLSVEPPLAPAQQPTRPQVSETEVARGYEISPGRWVEIKDEDLLALAPERTRTIDVEQ